MEWLTALMTLTLCVQYVAGGGTLSLKLKQYTNPGGLGANGHHCDGKFGIRMSACDYVFVLCLDHRQPTYENMRVCPYGRIQTGKIYNRDHVTFNSDIGGTPNPIHLKFNEWPGSVYFKAKVYDYDNMGHWDYVDNLQSIISAKPSRSSSGAKEKEYTINGRTKLRLGIEVYCDYGYYGEACTKFCVPMSSDVGHYECNDQGDKLCHMGWTGENCDEGTDECGPQPCLNGGHCRDEHNDFTCTCPPGFSGKTCADNLDDCASQPCKNGGVCQDGSNNYTCVCDAGYTGRNCDVMLDPCLMGECENNGTCQPLNHTDYQCLCMDGYFGDNCEFQHVPTEAPPTPDLPINTVEKGSTFGTSIRLMVEGMSEGQIEGLEEWIKLQLSEEVHMNKSDIRVSVTRSECTGDNGEAVTELVLYIQYSIEGMSGEEVRFVVWYISRFVERRFHEKLYKGRDCEVGKTSARMDKQDWTKTNWLFLVIGAASLLVLSLIIILIIILRRRRKQRRPLVESYACVMEPNDYEESVPRKLVVDINNGTSAFNNDLYCQTQPRTRLPSLPSLPSEPCSDDLTNRESGFDEDEYYNDECIYQKVD